MPGKQLARKRQSLYPLKTGLEAIARQDPAWLRRLTARMHRHIRRVELQLMAQEAIDGALRASAIPCWCPACPLRSRLPMRPGPCAEQSCKAAS